MNLSTKITQLFFKFVLLATWKWSKRGNEDLQLLKMLKWTLIWARFSSCSNLRQTLGREKFTRLPCHPWRSRGGHGQGHPQLLADQLTLPQPGGHITKCPSGFSDLATALKTINSFLKLGGSSNAVQKYGVPNRQPQFRRPYDSSTILYKTIILNYTLYFKCLTSKM